MFDSEPARSEIRWGQWISSRSLSFAQKPRESISCFMVMHMGVVGGSK